MKFIIEPINDTDCRIVDFNCYDANLKKVHELVIPATVEQEGKTWQVKDVACRIFVNKDSDPTKFRALNRLKKIIISEGIERIGAIMCNKVRTLEQLGNAETLREVVLPSTLRVIGESAFQNCEALESINIPDSVEEIGRNAFNKCEKLEVFAWPKSLRRIETSAFIAMKKPEGLYFIDIPDSIEYISNDQHLLPRAECKVSVKKWDIMDSSGLPYTIEKIDIPEGVTKINGQYKSARHVTFPSTLQEIGEEAFRQSEILNYISEIPASVRVIGAEAFNLAHNLTDEKTIRILSPEITIGKDAFWQEADYEVRLEADEAVMRSIMAQPGALNGTLIENIDVPDGVTQVNVKDCPKLVTLRLPDSAEDIKISNISAEIIASPQAWSNLCAHGYLYKYGYEGEVVIPEGVEKICNNCFDHGKFPSISLPSSLKEIGSQAFKFCSKISKITIPEGVGEIRPYTFYCCDALTTVDFAPGAKLQRVCDNAFVGCKLKTVEFPDGMTEIGTEVFIDNDALESLTFPASMHTYAENIVVRCKNLKKAIFLADDPATAVYPLLPGRKIDWYVPDHMVAHVKAYIEKAKADHPGLKGIGASSVKPLSKIKDTKKTVSQESLAKRKATAKRHKAKAVYTQPVSLQTKVKMHYSFAVNREHLPLLSHYDTRAALFAHYLRTRVDECRFDYGINWGLSYKEENSLMEFIERDKMEKAIVKLDFTDTDSLPIGFPKHLQSEFANEGSFEKIFAKHCSNFRKELPPAPAYLHMCLRVKVSFDFNIGETAKLKKEKIRFIEGWGLPGERGSNFAIIYDDRYIPASSITSDGPTENEYPIDEYKTFRAYKDIDEKEIIETDEEPVIKGVTYSISDYINPSLPFLNDILNQVNYDK